MIQRIPISKSGYERLRGELVRLERKDRFEVIRAIEVARGHGDLKENAEYHAAKERQGHVEGRIMELKDKLSRAEVIDCSKVTCDRIIFGTVVTLLAGYGVFWVAHRIRARDEEPQTTHGP